MPVTDYADLERALVTSECRELVAAAGGDIALWDLEGPELARAMPPAIEHDLPERFADAVRRVRERANE